MFCPSCLSISFNSLTSFYLISVWKQSKPQKLFANVKNFFSKQPTEAPKESDKEVKTRKVKKHVPKGNLPVVSGTASLSEDVKHRWAEMENEMHAEDKLVADTENKKNELESFIYETRDKLEGVYASFGNDEEKGKLREKLTASEVCPSPECHPLCFFFVRVFPRILTRMQLGLAL